MRKISEINELNVETAERFLRFCDVRHSGLHSIARISIVDDEEVLFYPASGDDVSMRGEQEVCPWTSSREFARLIKRSFEAAWEAASDCRKRIRELQTGVRASQSEVASESLGGTVSPQGGTSSIDLGGGSGDDKRAPRKP